MKKNNLIALSVLFSLCLLIFACRRDINNIINDRQEASSPLLESAKVWYGQHIDTENPNAVRLTPNWKENWAVKSTSGKDYIIVSAPNIPIDNEKISACRFFIFSVAEKAVTDEKIIEIYGREYDVQGNFDLLTKNVYEKIISGFHGDILQYDPNYFYISGAAYENGKMNGQTVVVKKSLASDFIKTKGKKINSLRTNDYCTPVTAMNIGFPTPVAPGNCYFTWLQSTSYSGGCPISVTNTYTGTVCPGACTSCGSASGSGSGSGSGAAPAGGGAGGPPSIYDILNGTNLSNTDLAKLETTFQSILNTCIGKAMYDSFKSGSKKFGINMNSNQPTNGATYSPSTNNITFKTSDNIDASHLSEELFHAYQNFYYPNGTTQYTGASGSANIEFEAKVLNDMNSTINGGAYLGGGDDYRQWLTTITHSTKMPLSFTSAQLSQYYLYMADFVQNSEYSSTIINTNLNPGAMFSLISSSTCSK